MNEKNDELNEKGRSEEVSAEADGELTEMLDSAVGIEFADGTRIVRYTDGKWFGQNARGVRTKIRYDSPVAAFYAVRQASGETG